MISTLAAILKSQDVNGLPQPSASPSTITTILNIVFISMGALALLMIVIAGFRYTISDGDPTSVANARRMIIYSVVGLVVISLAATIVNFILNKTQ